MWERNGVPVANFSQRVNVDTATIQGFELGGRIPLFEGWSFSGNYTLTASEITSGAKQGQPLGSQPRHSLNLGLNWRVNERFNAWVRGEYRANAVQRHELGKGAGVLQPVLAGQPGRLVRAEQERDAVGLGVQPVRQELRRLRPHQGRHQRPTAATSWSNSYRQVLEGRRLWVSANITF